VHRAILVVQQNLTPFARQCVSEMSSKYHLEVFQVLFSPTPYCLWNGLRTLFMGILGLPNLEGIFECINLI
jgi:hypothetical protein